MNRVTVHIDESVRISPSNGPIKSAWDRLVKAGYTPETNVYRNPWRYVYERVDESLVPIIRDEYKKFQGFRVVVEDLQD